METNIKYKILFVVQFFLLQYCSTMAMTDDCPIAESNLLKAVVKGTKNSNLLSIPTKDIFPQHFPDNLVIRFIFRTLTVPKKSWSLLRIVNNKHEEQFKIVIDTNEGYIRTSCNQDWVKTSNLPQINNTKWHSTTLSYKQVSNGHIYKRSLDCLELFNEFDMHKFDPKSIETNGKLLIGEINDSDQSVEIDHISVGCIYPPPTVSYHNCIVDLQATGNKKRTGDNFMIRISTDAVGEQKVDIIPPLVDNLSCNCSAGPRGLQGLLGPQGLQGPIGPRGEVGPPGEKGAQGVSGINGLQGAMGPTGPRGESGPRGNVSPQGQRGEQGIMGQPGLQGPVGPPGNATVLDSHIRDISIKILRELATILSEDQTVDRQLDPFQTALDTFLLRNNSTK